jgi:acyl carrier protein
MYTSDDVVKILKKIGVDLPQDYHAVKLIDDDLMDSLQIMQLFLEVETLIGVTIDQEEINPENLADIDAVVQMINRLKK